MMEASLAQDEVAFARMCKQYNQPVVFVRSLCDSALPNQVEIDMMIPEYNQDGADTLVKRRECR